MLPFYTNIMFCIKYKSVSIEQIVQENTFVD